MNTTRQPYSAHYVTTKRQLHKKKQRVQEKSDFCFYGFMISGATGLFLWWGAHAFFGVFTETFTPEQMAGEAKNVISLWNVLMYFVPGIFWALSAGCAVTGIYSFVITELIYQGELWLIRRKKYLPGDPGTVAGDKGEADA
ncbi:hypothetical protein ACQFN5_00380 (plasmid) [Klebsiella sp. WOUb02]|uniref:hypothetical protein n=1 Tax=Klebsiella sp. WOUb02 TaxID=3161071 RepID=UPI003CFB13DE